jgi:hypothetical protein
MAFNINEFRSQMQGDGARPNLFEVTLPFPAFALPGTAQTKLSFMCKTAQLPGSTVNSVPVQYFGRELKFAGNRTFQDWSITVINDEDFSIRKGFERWMERINGHVDNVRSVAYVTPASYVGQATVVQYKKNGQSPQDLQYNFKDIFCTDISAIDLDWGSNDAIEEFTVNFSYSYWTSTANKGNDQATATANAPPQRSRAPNQIVVNDA